MQFFKNNKRMFEQLQVRAVVLIVNIWRLRLHVCQS
jgi:hypothetical protein